MLRSALLIGFACASLIVPAQAEDAAAHYEGYAKGLHVFDVDLALSLQPASYRLQIGFRLTGVLGALLHGDGSTVVQGRFDGPRPVPQRLFSSGQFRGSPHVTQIDWQNGQPVVVQMVPPAEEEREVVPDAERAHTVDALSAVAGLIRQVGQTGRCESAARTFDGARLVQFDARTAGTETLEPTDRSSFAGPALRCDVSGQMIAGFARGDDRAEVGKVKKGAAWFARAAPGLPMVPVRIVFYSQEGTAAATLYVKTLAGTTPQP